MADIKNRKVVITWSGGLDSTSLIHYYLENGAQVFPIFVNRGQTSYSKELEAVTFFNDYFAEKYPNYNRVFELELQIPPLIFKAMTNDKSKTHVLRNSDLLNQAVRYALIQGAEYVLQGSNLDDVALGFGDGSSEYLETKNREIQIGVTEHPLELQLPFLDLGWDKSKIVEWALENDLPIERTWSCWSEGVHQCGKLDGTCDPCEKRKMAFTKIRKQDPTTYMDTTSPKAKGALWP